MQFLTSWRLILATPKTTYSVCANRSDPRFFWMKFGVQHTQTVDNFMALQYFQRNDQRISDEIRIDCRVEDMNCAVIGSREK